MNVIRKAVSAVGGIFLAALLIATLAPKAARGVAAALVQVTNTTANPVPMIDADNPAYQPASLGILLQDAASTSITASSSLPSGGAYRELVINWVTGACFGPAAGSPAFTISLATDGSQLSFFAATGSAADNITYFGSKTILYASPGSTISLVALNGTGIQIQTGANESVTTRGAEATCLINADGYYVTQ